MDVKKAEEAVKTFLEAIGEDPEREGLRDTPHRVAAMFAELTAGRDKSPQSELARVFDAPASEVVVERDIQFNSTCEHHLMPFFGKVQIAYIPNGKVVGISKLARTVEVFAKRLQIQERMTDEIAQAIMDYLQPQAVVVLCRAEHTCMTCRGVKKPGTQTVTLAVKGTITEAKRAEILSLLRD